MPPFVVRIENDTSVPPLGEGGRNSVAMDAC
jgi:hypothetical protein